MTRAIAFAPPLQENKDVKRLVELMKDPSTVLMLVHQMDNMEKQLGQALTDLDIIKQQLAQLGKKPFQQKYESAVRYAKDGVKAAQDDYTTIKKSFLDSVKKGLEAVKTKGAAGIEKALNVMDVKKSLLAQQERINQSIDRAEKSIAKVHALGNEYHAIGYHANRMAKTMANKEIEGGIKGNGKINAMLKKPFEMSKNRMLRAQGNVLNCLNLIDRIEAVAQRGREQKPSIKDQLEANKPAPQKAVQRSANSLAHER